MEHGKKWLRFAGNVVWKEEKREACLVERCDFFNQCSTWNEDSFYQESLHATEHRFPFARYDPYELKDLQFGSIPGAKIFLFFNEHEILEVLFLENYAMEEERPFHVERYGQNFYPAFHVKRHGIFNPVPHETLDPIVGTSSHPGYGQTSNPP